MTTTPEQSVPLSRIIFVFSPDYVRGVIARALQIRSKASEGVRSALSSAITDTIRMDGFRDASKAPPHLLKEHVFEELFHGNDRLAGAVLKAWVEPQKELHDLVAHHLRSQDIPVDGPNLRERAFDLTWPRDEWMDEVDAVMESNPHLDADDVGMMVCYVSGIAPELDEERPEVKSPVLSEWIDRLGELPSDAPEWEEIDAFVSLVTDMAEGKALDRALHRIAALAKSLSETLDAMQRDFESELRYLDLDLASWDRDAAERPAVIPNALELAEGLRSNLAEYKSVRPQANSREEEATRAAERAGLESTILGAAADWDRLVNPSDDPGDDPPPDGLDELPEDETPTADSDDPGDGRAHADTQSDEQPSLSPGGSIDAGTPERIVSMEEHEALLSELDRLKRGGESLEAENARLVQARLDLGSDRRSLDSENSELRDELSQSRDMEETWRRAYVSTKRVDAGSDGEAPDQPGSVNEAIARAEDAEESFPSQLMFALNSKSAKNSPFRKPDEVFDALAWLATVYHQRRTKPGKPPHFDMLLKESCSGWSYKAQQTDVTKEQFDEWYTTTVDGRRYDLGPHLGKGTTSTLRTRSG